MLLVVLTAAAAVALGAANYLVRQADQVQAALNDGKVALAHGEWDSAIAAYERGLGAAHGLPFYADQADELQRRLRRAEQERTAADAAAAGRQLRSLVDRVRFLYGVGSLSPQALRGLEAHCRALWQGRDRVVQRLDPGGASALEPAHRDDLLDLAIFWADLQVRLAPPAAIAAAHRSALTVLAEAEDLFGPSAVLEEERKLHGAPARPDGAADESPDTAWAHYALGRTLLRSGDLERAAYETERAVRIEPQGLWPNFYRGLCASRLGRYADAGLAYSVCIGAAPEAAVCFCNRGLALAAQGHHEQALLDYDQALRLDPTLAAAALNRGMLHYEARRYADALADLRRAQELGAEPAVVTFDLALVHLARGERADALRELRRALGHNPQQPDARKLFDALLRNERHDPSAQRFPTGSEKSAPARRPDSR
jgi:tetratricopeptide (TPR) repeat protein